MGQMNLAFDIDLQEMVSYRKNVTGIDYTVFISSKGNVWQVPRIKVAIDPPDSLDPRSETASISLEGEVVAGTINRELLQRVRRFLELNRQVLMDCWDYRIDIDELRQRLRPVGV
jgi:hypothetical protein